MVTMISAYKILALTHCVGAFVDVSEKLAARQGLGDIFDRDFAPSLEHLLTAASNEDAFESAGGDNVTMPVVHDSLTNLFGRQTSRCPGGYCK